MYKTVFLLPMLIVFLFHSCKKEQSQNCKTPNEVSFKNDIQTIFNQNCVSSGCHAANKPAGGLNLESPGTYMELLEPKSGYIDTLNPNSSLLYVSMTSATNPMPPKGKLDDCTTQMVLKWIQQKAKNN